MSLIVSTKSDHELQFLNKLCKVMENEEFRQFFHKYLDGWDDIRTSIMFMKLYACVDDEYYKKNGGNKLEPDKIVEIIKEMISNRDCRKIIMDEMTHFMQDNKKLLTFYSGGQHILPIAD